MPLRAIPRMIPRSVATTVHLVLILAGVQSGNPAVVQTVVATGPLFVFGWDVVVHGRRPTLGLAVGAAIAFAGVTLA